MCPLGLSQRDSKTYKSGKYFSKRSILSTIDLRNSYGDQRGVADRKTILCWQVIKLLKNNGYF